MENTKISPPWVEYWGKLLTLFGDDPDISMDFEEEKKEIKMYVNGADKADALTRLLEPEIDFGGVKLLIAVIPSNEEVDDAMLIEHALKGNPHIAEFIHSDPNVPFSFNYVMFRKEVAQYNNDNMGDPHGNTSCLYADLARELLGCDKNVMYSTDVR